MRSTSPLDAAANKTRLPSAESFFTSSTIAGTEPWNRVVGWESKI